MTAAAKDTANDSAPFGARDVPREEKPGLVRGVFDSVATRYDLMNDAMSLGAHRAWKDMAVTRANPQPGELLVDVAGGTGDLARLWRRKGARVARRRGGPPPSAVVCDVNEAMLRAGRGRRRARSGARDDARGGDGLMWVAGDAERLPFPDRVADAVTIAFGIRNVTNRDAALAEMRRVLKPGGRFLCLEFSRPTTAALEAVYGAWSERAIPRIGQALARDRDSYVYLVESIRRFPDQRAFAREVEAAGFANVAVANYSGGIVALHTGWRV